MKIASVILTTIFALSSFALANQVTTQAESFSNQPSVQPIVHTRIIGHVVFEKSYTMSCLATNCPPSQPYYDLILDDAQVDGIGAVETVVFQDFKKVLGVDEKPNFVVYGGVSLKEGMYVIVEADVRVNQAGNKVYAIATNPAVIKLVPARYPVMLY